MSKRKVLTLDERVRVIELAKWKSARKIADELGVGKTQIQNILKRKIEVLDDYEKNVPGDRKRARKITGNEEINDLVLQWFKDATRRRLPISGHLLMQRALKFAEDLGNSTFKASTGWLASFLKRNNIAFGTMSGERGDVNREVVDDWKKKIPVICEGYNPKDIFNMDETGLFFRDTTRKSYHMKGEDLAGGKRSKERLTIALCASMTGEKLQPMVIGKSAHPRCFSRMKPENLPVMYRANKKAWMNSELMTEWLRNVDRQMRKQGRNILLFLDNAPAHPSNVKLNNVKIAFLPPNTTSLVQPMDQGIIQTLKLKYHKKQLTHVLSQVDRTSKVGSAILKEISVLDCIFWVSAAWKEVESSTIQKCFINSGFVFDMSEMNIPCESESSNEDDDDDEVPLSVLNMSHDLFGCEFKELAKLSKDIPTCDEQMRNWESGAAEILKELHQSRDDYEIDNEDNYDQDVSNTSAPPCSLNEAQDYLDKIKCFVVSKGDHFMLDSIMTLQGLFDSNRAESYSRQSKISDFFHKMLSVKTW